MLTQKSRNKMKGVNKSPSLIGMGCFALGGPFHSPDKKMVYAYGKVNDEESIKAVHKAIDMGVNIFDTADVYGLGRSERVLGNVLKEYRDDVIIATKFSNRFDEQKQVTLEGKETSPDGIRNALQDSLQRLQTDYIDIYQLHESNFPIEEAEKVKDTLEDLISEGLIKSFGWSTDDQDRAKIFAQSPNCSSMQYALNTFHRNDAMINLCKEYDIYGLIRSPLASGTLTGKYTSETKVADDHMLSIIDFTSERYQKRRECFSKLTPLFKDHGYTLIQGLLAWIATKDERAIPIPGAKTVEQVTENFEIIELGPLSKSVMDEIEEIVKDNLAGTLIRS